MTADYMAQIEELMDQASELPYGSSKMTLLEEAVRLADTHQDVFLGDAVRKQLVETATFSGYPEKALVAFSWRLAQSNREPEKFPENNLLWQYKWIVGKLVNFPQITQKQIEESLDDLARRSLRCGCGLRAVHGLRRKIASAMYEVGVARQLYRKWEKMPRDRNSDCAACEQNQRVWFHVSIGKKEKALQLAEPILRGSMRCATIPHCTYATVLLPLLQLGQIEQAVEYHRKGYHLIRNNCSFLDDISDHLIFLTLTENRTQALKLFEKHLQWALDSKDERNRWEFYLAARLLMACLIENGQASLKLRLPKTTPGYREDGRYETASLATWIEETCRDLAQRFDARNGNDGFTRRLASNRRLKRWRTPYPLQRSRIVREKGDA